MSDDPFAYSDTDMRREALDQAVKSAGHDPEGSMTLRLAAAYRAFISGEAEMETT